MQNQQQGGGMFAVYNPFFTPQQEQERPQQSKQEKADKDDKKSYIDKLNSVISKVEDNALTSDINQVYKMATKMIEDAETVGSDITARQFYSILGKLNEAKVSKSLYQKYLDHGVSNGTLGDTYIGDNGLMLGMDKNGKIQQIDANTYSANRDKFRILTNNDVMYARNDVAAFNNDIIKSVGTAISMKDINSEMDNIIKGIEKESYTYDTYDRNSIASSQVKDIIDGLKAVYSSGADYKATIKDAGTLKKIYSAQNYLWNNLSLKAKQKLIANEATSGSQNPQQDAYKHVLTRFMMGAGREYEIKIDDKYMNGGSSGGGGEQLTDTSYYALIETQPRDKDVVLSIGSTIDSNGVNTGQHNIISTKASVNPILDRDSKPVQSNSLLSEVLESGSGGGLDLSSMNIAGVRIDPEYAKSIRISSNNVKIAELPYKLDDNGNKVIDYTISKKMGDFSKKIEALRKSNPNVTQMEIDNVKESMGIPKKVETTSFYIFDTVVPEKLAESINIDNDKNLTDLLDPMDSDSESYKSILKIYKMAEKQASDNNYFSYDINTFGYGKWFGNEDLYKAQVSIPISDSRAAVIYAGKNAVLQPKSNVSKTNVLQNVQDLISDNKQMNINLNLGK